MIRSTASCLKGNLVVEAIGERGGEVRWVIILFCWQTAQPEIKLETKMDRPATRSHVQGWLWCGSVLGDPRGASHGWNGGGRSELLGERTSDP